MEFKNYMFAIIIINLNIFTLLLNAMPRYYSLNNLSPYSIKSRSEITRLQSGWALQNKHPSKVD